jgi:tetratricopeptide (TPR) repeat protein
MRLLFLLLLIGLAACGQQTKKYIPNKKAIQLEDSAIQLMKVYSSDTIPPESSYQKAIQLLNEAIIIDSNLTSAYSNKAIFELHLKQYDKSLETAKRLIEIKPNVPEFYLLAGMIYESIGDTINSYKYFNIAVNKSIDKLDTMTIKNKKYDYLLMNEGVYLILAGQQIKGNEILKQLYKKSNDDFYKELIMQFLDKSRKEVFENIFNPKSTTETKITYPK